MSHVREGIFTTENTEKCGRTQGTAFRSLGTSLCCRSLSVFSVVITLAVLLLLLPLTEADAQRNGRRDGMMDRFFGNANDFYVPPGYQGNTPYDGRFTFARIKYRGYAHFTDEGPGWAHDFPRADLHLMKLMSELTSMNPFLERGPFIGGNTLSMDDPEVFKYPVAYLSEPGGWAPTEPEIEGLRKYFQKGGFMIVDDFGRNDIYRLDEILKRAIPKAQLIPLDASHPIFDSFFKITLDVIQYTYYGQPVYFGLFQDNDPKKRLLAIVNYNNDIGDFWQFSDTGFNPVELSNEAYKLGINYLVYALTH
jgi:hypothetical protein